MSFTQLAEKALENAKKLDHWIESQGLPAQSFEQSTDRPDHSDPSGLYSYRNQPSRVLFALDKLVSALAPVLGYEVAHGCFPPAGFSPHLFPIHDPLQTHSNYIPLFFFTCMRYRYTATYFLAHHAPPNDCPGPVARSLPISPLHLFSHSSLLSLDILLALLLGNGLSERTWSQWL